MIESAPVVASAGSYITQPGPSVLNGSCFPNSSYNVATLSAWVPLVLDGSHNLADVALARVLPGTVRTDGQILGIGPVSSTPANYKKGTKVQKSGAVTGVTKGKITGLNETIYVYVCVGTPSSTSTCDELGTAKYTKQIEVSGVSFSAQGDSGALVTTTGTCPQPVGLIVAAGALTYVTPIAQAFSELVTHALSKGGVGNVSIVTGCQPTAADYADAMAEDSTVDATLSAADDLYAYLDSQWLLAGDGLEAVAVDVSGSEPVLNVQTVYSAYPAVWSWQQQLINSGLVPSSYEGFSTEVTQVPVVNPS